MHVHLNLNGKWKPNGGDDISQPQPQPPHPPPHTVGVQASRHLKIWEKNIPWEEKSNAEVLRWRHFDINEESKEVSGGNYKGEE